MRRIAVLDAPSNLGLRPPTESSVPGCGKAPGALRDHQLLARLGARDAGCLTPPRYDPGGWRPGDGICHAQQIASYTMRLAERIGGIIDTGEFPLILGGDCSILLGSALAMHRLGEAVGGRIGLVFVDGHSDFRHPGNASYVGAAAGEDLALVTGRGQADLAAIEGRRPYFRDADVVVMGIRGHDEYRLDLQAAGIVARAVPTLRAEGAARSAQWAIEQLADCAGFWAHVDVDVLDPAVMPAVDAPDPGGIAFGELELLIAGLVSTPHCLGLEITVFDPDYDPDGGYAADIADTLVAGLAPLRPPAPTPAHVAMTATTALPPVAAPPPARAATTTGARSASAARAKPRRGTGDATAPGRLARGAVDDATRPGRPVRGVVDDATTPGGLARGAVDDATAPGGLARGAVDDATRPGRSVRGVVDDATAPGGLARGAVDDATAPGRLARSAADDSTAPGKLRRRPVEEARMSAPGDGPAPGDEPGAASASGPASESGDDSPGEGAGPSGPAAPTPRTPADPTASADIA